MKKRLVSGIKPTGLPHIGNWEGMLKNCVGLQDEYESFPFIADWHAMTNLEVEMLAELSQQVAVDWLATGIKPGTLFIQSHVPEHAELHVILSMVTPVPWLERCPTYKDITENLSNKEKASYGLLGYPVLQAADIVIYKGEVVPVGKDQLPHLELSREIVRRFNFHYGNVFPEPQALLTETPDLPGTDGRKMSKSYNNTIYLSDRHSEVQKKVMGMITDPARVKRTDPGNPEICPVFAYHKLYNKGEVELIGNDCRTAKIGCVDCKKRMSERLIQALEPFHERRSYWDSNPQKIKEVLEEGAKRARNVARETMEDVREAIKIK